jgi:UDP-N-acetylmuramoyl-tripeptide--D-alanyl-D-alanine ligase
VAVAAGLVATVAAGLRWLRVAQREHYLPGSVGRFALRWWTVGPNLVLGLAVVLAVALSPWAPVAAAVGCVGLVFGPFGLSLRGRTSKLAWTRRLRTLAVVCAGLNVSVLTVGIWMGIGPTAAVLTAALVPITVDAGLVLTAPLERRLVEPYVRRAAKRLQQVGPVVVAITGSYGKTSTKLYVAHLLEGSRTVVASPASFNNRAGLARAVNERLSPGTEVFVAEMGTYGRGEIAELCSWCAPDVAVITAIGPVHLERMGSEEVIAEAKAEILEKAPVAVLNVDHPLIERLADERASKGERVVRCSAHQEQADVAVLESGKALVGGRPIAEVETAAPPTNVACAVAVALELGVGESVVVERLPTLPTAEHRLNVLTGSSGATVVDDTYNSNPAGAALALSTLARLVGSGKGPGSEQEERAKTVVVTPGMVELGPRQREANASFAAAASAICTHLVVVGHTNRRALLEGARQGDADVVVVDDREEAVAWVRQHVGKGDAVLYENDLPDHFP